MLELDVDPGALDKEAWEAWLADLRVLGLRPVAAVAGPARELAGEAG